MFVTANQVPGNDLTPITRFQKKHPWSRDMALRGTLVKDACTTNRCLGKNTNTYT